MPQCLVAQLVVTSDYPAGVELLAPSADVPCPGVLALTSDDYARFNNSPWNLSAEDGLTLSVAIIGVWSAAWALRALVRALNVDGEVNE